MVSQKIVKLEYYEFTSTGYYDDGHFYHHSVNDEAAYISHHVIKSKVWFKDGAIHRTTGPAIVSENVDIWWYVNGENITDNVQKWCMKNNICEKSLTLEDIDIMLFEIQLDNSE